MVAERKWEPRLIATLLVTAVLGVYANSLRAPFIFDDFPAVVRNLTIRNLGNLPEVLHPPLDAAGATGRPLVNLTYAINYAVGGLSVRGYHLGSVLLHALATLLFFGVLRRTFQLPGLRSRWGDGAARRAGGIALLWAVHPLLTESVVCIAQRNEVLMAMFCFGVFYGFVRAAEAEPRTARWWLLGSVAAGWLGMASKEVMAVVPLLVLLYDRTFVAGTWAEVWRRRIYYHGALMSGWLLLAWLMVHTDQRAGIVGFGLGLSSWDYLVTQCRALVIYLKLSVWPHPLIVDYNPVPVALAQVWPEAVAVVALGGTTLWGLWRHPKTGFLGAWFFVILAPSSSFVPLTTQLIAEHRMYLPLAAIVVAGWLGLELILPRRRWPVIAVLATGLALVTVRRNADYLDELKFWQGTIDQQPTNARLWASLGYYYTRHQQWHEAIAAYEKAITLRDNFADAHSDLGSLLLEVGRTDDAVAHERLAASLKPADPAIRFNYGVALERAGALPAAVAEWQEALRLQPGLGAALRKLGGVAIAGGQAGLAAGYFAQAVAADTSDVEAWSGWGQALTLQNKLPEAAEKFQAALKIDPELAELHYNLGDVWLQLNRPAEARAAFAEALRLRPAFPAASHNLALALVQLGRPAEAVPYYEAVLKVMPDSAQVHHNYALALGLTGQVGAAISEEEAALRLDPGLAEARANLARLRRR